MKPTNHTQLQSRQESPTTKSQHHTTALSTPGNNSNPSNLDHETAQLPPIQRRSSGPSTRHVVCKKGQSVHPWPIVSLRLYVTVPVGELVCPRMRLCPNSGITPDQVSYIRSAKCPFLLRPSSFRFCLCVSHTFLIVVADLSTVFQYCLVRC